MDDWLSRRAVLKASLGATLGAAEDRLSLRRLPGGAVQGRVAAGSFNVRDFGAKGDGTSDDSAAFQAAINAAGSTGGVVYLPATQHLYVLGSKLTLMPNITIQGDSASTVRLRPTEAADPALEFVGTAEAAGLNLTLADFTLQAARHAAGTPVAARNFRNLLLSRVEITHFHTGVRASWGIGVKLASCGLSWNSRALEVGGSGSVGGTRGGARQRDPFLDTVIVTGCSFAQNELDINDMGSTRSLGGILIQACSFFEAYTQPVAAKRLYVRLANRKGIVIDGNWFEGGQPSRTFILLDDTDHDGDRIGPCSGATIFGNDFLQTGTTDTAGADVAACEAAVVFGNCFEFSSGNAPIRLHSYGGRVTVGHNAYLTYPDRAEYPSPVEGSTSNHLVLDPGLPVHVPGELRVERRLSSGVATLKQAPLISPDAASAEYFVVEITSTTPATVQDPVNPQLGQRLTFDVRNRSGGSAQIAWGPTYLIAGPFPGPSGGRRRTITFYYEGTNWVETGRAGADI